MTHEKLRDRSAAVAPDLARDLTATASELLGLSREQEQPTVAGELQDADGKLRFTGLFDTQEAAAHAVNAAIRRAGLEGEAQDTNSGR